MKNYKLKKVSFGTGVVVREYKAYENFFRNKKLRRFNNARKIVNGKIISYWSEPKSSEGE